MPHPPNEEELGFFGSGRVARLATAGKSGEPSVGPCCFAVTSFAGEPVVVTPLDEKPKSVPVRELRRVRNIERNPNVALVVDRYSEDWRQLQFVQLRGRARLVEPEAPGFDEAVSALRMKYEQYRVMSIERSPLIWIDGLSASSWGWDGIGPAWVTRDVTFDAVVRGRRSVRALLPDPVPRAVIRAAIERAGWAPSPHGRQPWRFAVVESAERKQCLADAMTGSWQEQLALDGQDQSIIDLRVAKSRERILTAPALILVCLHLADLDVYPDPSRQSAETTMAIQSLGAAVQTLLLSIYESGYDSGWMCAPLFCPEVVRDALGLDRELIPHALIPVGHAAKDPVRRPRLAVDDLIASWQ